MTRIFGTYTLLTIFSLVTAGVSAQKLSANGRFNSRHFSVIDYESNAQIWTGIQGEDGYAYFGNSQDILAFNGVNWSKISIDQKHTSAKVKDKVNQSAVRSMLRGSDKHVYIGRAENFGYLSHSDIGETVYVPLYASEENNSCGSIWNIFEAGNDEILFIAENCFFRYKNKKVERLKLPAGFEGFSGRTSCRLGNGVFLVYHNAQTGDNRIERYIYFDLITGKMKEVRLPEHIEIRNIRGSFEINGMWYILDISGRFYSAKDRGGVLTWNAENATILPELSNFAPNYISRYKDHLYYGTEENGLIMADLNGHIIRNFDTYDEVESLYVNYFFHDDDENIWMCLDNGIQFIETSSPVTYFKKKEGVSSLTEAIDFHSGQLIIGTHTGLYTPETSNTQMSFVGKEGLKEFIFDVETFNTSQGLKTMVIGNDGVYAFDMAKDTAYNVCPAFAYSFRQDPKNKDVFYITLEYGIGKITLLPNGNWEYHDLVTDLKGGTFSLVVHNNKVYFGITSVGVGVYSLKSRKLHIIREKVKTKPGQTMEQVTEGITYYVEEFRGKIYCASSNGIAVVSDDDKKLLNFEGNKRFFSRGKNGFHRLINIQNEQLWVVNWVEGSAGRSGNVQVGWLENNDGKWSFTQWASGGLKRTGIISSIEKSPMGDIWLGATSGLYVLNLDALKNYRKPITLSVDRFEVNEKIVRYNVSHAKSLDPLAYFENSFRVTFHANSFSGMNNIEYRYKLEGFNDAWSEWSDLNFASFQKVPEGTYTIKIQARTPYGVVSKTFAYEVTILPPWYRTIWAFLLYGVVLIALILFIIQLSTQRVKRQNQRLEKTVQERTREIAEQNTQLEQQKEEITQKTTDILDSIQYAKRIQSTILPAASRLNELFYEHFVFYRPKDIVSGDFYWAREVQGKTIFSAIDCTGHGVPGSLVSIVGNNGLLRVVNEFKLTEPNEILDKLREIVVSAFRSDGNSDVKDGMDIALCSLDYETGILKYAGANNECVIIRNREVFELKPDKQPIGQFIDAKPFTQKEFQLEENDCIYLYTDGYVDQFGGDKLKKFKSRPFKTMLTEISHLPMQEQFEAIQRAFDSWKADLEQIDDVCVFGVRYKKK